MFLSRSSGRFSRLSRRVSSVISDAAICAIVSYTLFASPAMPDAEVKHFKAPLRCNSAMMPPTAMTEPCLLRIRPSAPR